MKQNLVTDCNLLTHSEGTDHLVLDPGLLIVGPLLAGQTGVVRLPGLVPHAPRQLVAGSVT